MNNADMPAMAVKVVASVAARRQAEACGMDCKDITFTGLTKREYMAIEFTKATMIGIHSLTEKGEFHNWSSDDFAREGLEQADALLKAMEEQS